MNTVEIAEMIRGYFAELGECISVLGYCDACKYYDICNTMATAYRMVLEGKYYG